MTLRGAAFIPDKSSLAVARGSCTVEKHVTKIILRPGKPGFGSLAVATYGAYEIDIGAPAILVAAPEHVQRVGVATFRGAEETRKRAAKVFRQSVAFEKHAAEANLRFADSADGRGFHPYSGILRVAERTWCNSSGAIMDNAANRHVCAG